MKLSISSSRISKGAGVEQVQTPRRPFSKIGIAVLVAGITGCSGVPVGYGPDTGQLEGDAGQHGRDMRSDQISLLSSSVAIPRIGVIQHDGGRQDASGRDAINDTRDAGVPDSSAEPLADAVVSRKERGAKCPPPPDGNIDLYFGSDGGSTSGGGSGGGGCTAD